MQLSAKAFTDEWVSLFALHYFGIAQVGLDETSCPPALVLGTLERLAGLALVGECRRQHQRRADECQRAHQRMEQRDDEQKNRQPRRVEEREDPGTAEERAQGTNVAQRVGLLARAEPCRLAQEAIEDPRPEHAIERAAERRE